MPDIPDEQLVGEYLAGNEKALEILIGRYLKPIYGFVYRYAKNGADAEDIAQEVFVKLWRHIKKFDQKKKFKTWLFSIAKNSALDFFKKKKVLTFSDFSWQDESSGGESGNPISDALADEKPLPLESLVQEEVNQAIASVVSKLSAKYRLIIFLRYSSQMTFQEIAETLDEPMDTVKSRHRRALIRARKLLIKNKFNF